MKKYKHGALFALLCVMTILTTTAYGGGREIFVGEPDEAECRNCHDNVAQFPMLWASNPDRHHLLIGTPIPLLYESKAPDAPGGVPGEPYDCFSCHEFAWNDQTMTPGLLDTFRNCLNCHPVSRVTGSPGMGTNVHHETETFQLRECDVCHDAGEGNTSRWGR